MKIKLTLQRSTGPAVDLMATVDTGATIGDLADRLWRADPMRSATSQSPGQPTLFVRGSKDTVFNPAVKLADSGLLSGMTVGLTNTPDGYADKHGETVAVVTVIEATGVVREYPLRTHTGTIGRDRDCAVVLDDVMVSRQHLRFSIGSLPEIVDLGSANGVEVNGSRVARAVIRPDDVVQVGDTRLSIRATAIGVDGTAEGHIRSPRLDPRYAGRSFDAPEPPKRPEKMRFPLIALLAPMALGLALYLITGSLLTLMFVALSPLMIIGYAVEAALSGKAAYKKAAKQFDADLEELAKEASAAAEEETQSRRREHPSIVECVAAVRRRSPLLWTRRPEDPGFCELRLGLGRQSSRTVVTLPTARDLPRDLMAKAIAVAEEFSTVEGVPVLATPGEHGAIGIAGPRDRVLAASRALMAQLVTLHSPAELVLAAFVNDEQSRDWEWLKWLPHTTSQHSPLSPRHLASNDEAAVALASALEDLLAARVAEEAVPRPVVVVLMENAAPVERSRIVELAERAWQHGIYVVWLADDTTQLPAACRTFVTLEPGASTVGYVHTGQTVARLETELLDAAVTDELGRLLSPLVDVGARIDDDSDLPRTVSMLAVAGSQVIVAPGHVLESWIQNRSILSGRFAPEVPSRKAGTLRAVIGRSAIGPHVLDLREDGPHALVGGTTGSGKSELLQAWIMALAAAHSPQRLTFMLIDYKGGSAFKDLALLPHTVGTFTDLDPHLVRRALTSLRAELREREKQLAQHQAKDLVELERKGVADAPPSLLIVIDEFAALVKELPEFVDGVVDVAQRGRSLGVHLILATQRPAGVVTDNLRANTNLRLALRTADEGDSTDVLGTPQAAFFDSSIPGRAVSKTGPGRLVPFQTGYVGGWTSQTPPQPEILLEELRFGPRTIWDTPETDDARIDLGATDLQRMIAAIALANQTAGIRRPRQPWLPALVAAYDLKHIRTGRTDSELVFGVCDRPEKQDQPPIAFHPDQQGNLAVYGTGGVGKTVLLRTLAIAAGFTVRGGPCHVYGLDFASRGLSMLEELPHVGSIVMGADTERTIRLINWLTELVIERSDRYSQVGAGTITDYRKLADAPAEPRILLLVDGMGAFRQAYEKVGRYEYLDAFCQLAVDGRAVGVHMLVTADRPASVPATLGAAVQTRIVMRMADPSDYSALDVPGDVLGPMSPPGRGLLLGEELQVAVLGGAGATRLQATAIHDFAKSMRHAGLIPAPEVQKMPDRVLLRELPSILDEHPVLGLSFELLSPVTFVPKGGFLISGPPGSGRTCAMRTLAEALIRWDPHFVLHLISPSRRSELADLPLWRSRILGLDSLKDGAEKLAADLKPAEPAAIFLEGVGEIAGYGMDEGIATAVTDLVRACVENNGFAVGEGETSTLTPRSGALEVLKRSRYGLALTPDSGDGDLFNTVFPMKLRRSDFTPGRGLLVQSGRTLTVGLGWAGE